MVCQNSSYPGFKNQTAAPADCRAAVFCDQVFRLGASGLPMKRSSLLICLVLQACLFAQLARALDHPAACVQVKIPETKVGTFRIYTLDNTTVFSSGYEKTLDKISDYDYGLRLILIKKEAGTDKRIYASTGSADSYILKPNFFQSCRGYDLLILAETGTEYSWGLRVFTYKNGEVKDLGSIPLALVVDSEEQDDSILPYITFKEAQASIELSFKKEVVRDPGGLDEKRYPAGKIEYLIENGKLVEKLN